MPIPRVLVIGGSDSGAGAGIQADVKTVMALGGYATTVITSVTAQDTQTVRVVCGMPPELVNHQFRMVFDDIGADAIKTGMLGEPAVVETVAELIAGTEKPVVVDPVMVATSGDPLLNPDATGLVKTKLVKLATVLTPNIPEAELLLGRRIRSIAQQREAAVKLLKLGPKAVLLKGGHLPGAGITDFLATAEGVVVFVSPRIETRHTHGTGCTLASAIATGLAQGRTLRDAVTRARAYVYAAIAAAPGLGAGHGPLQHAVSVGGGS